MNPTTNPWASSDPTQNITLAEADQFKNQFAAAIGVQFADRFVKTGNGDIVKEPELRRSSLPAAAVNLWGTLEGVGAAPVNVAGMRAAVRAAAHGSNPARELETILHQALPKSDVSTIILRISGVGAAVGVALAQIA